MKGKMTISREEVRKMVESWVTQNALTPKGFRVTNLKTDGYGNYDPGLEVEFTNEPDVGEGPSDADQTE